MGNNLDHKEDMIGKIMEIKHIKINHKEIILMIEIILIKEDMIGKIMEIKHIKINHKEIILMIEIILVKENIIRNIMEIKLIKTSHKEISEIILNKEDMIIINNLDLREKEKIFVNNSLKEPQKEIKEILL